MRICNLNPIRGSQLHKDSKLKSLVEALGRKKPETFEDLQEWIHKVSDNSRNKRSIDEEGNSEDEVVLNWVKRSASNTTENITVECTSETTTTPTMNLTTNNATTIGNETTKEHMTTQTEGNDTSNAEVTAAETPPDPIEPVFDHSIYGKTGVGNDTLSEDFKTELEFTFYMSLIEEKV